MSFTVRSLQRADVSASLRLHKFAKYNGQNIFSANFLTSIAELHDCAVTGEAGAQGFVAVTPTETDGENAEVVGVLTAQLEDRKCVLLTLVVRSDYRGQGVAKALLDELLRWSRGVDGGAAATIVTDVAQANSAALVFFKRQGFKQVGRASGRSVELELKACLGPSSGGARLSTAVPMRPLASQALAAGRMVMHSSKVSKPVGRVWPVRALGKAQSVRAAIAAPGARRVPGW